MILRSICASFAEALALTSAGKQMTVRSNKATQEINVERGIVGYMWIDEIEKYEAS